MSNAEGESGGGPDLGTIQRVELRNVWSHEAEEFTPWLAENIGRLSDALGMDIEVEAQELQSVAMRWTSWHGTETAARSLSRTSWKLLTIHISASYSPMRPGLTPA